MNCSCLHHQIQHTSLRCEIKRLPCVVATTHVCHTPHSQHAPPAYDSCTPQLPCTTLLLYNRLVHHSCPPSCISHLTPWLPHTSQHAHDTSRITLIHTPPAHQCITSCCFCCCIIAPTLTATASVLGFEWWTEVQGMHGVAVQQQHLLSSLVG